MDVVSPTRVAAPCRFAEIEMAIIGFTGEIFSFLERRTAMGASIKTVATLSIKAEIKPAKSERLTMIHFTSGSPLMILSAIRCGILDSVNKATSPIVPAIIKMTFQSIAKKTSWYGKIRKTTKIAAEMHAISGLRFVKIIIKP